MDNQSHKPARYDPLAASSRLQNAIKYCTKVQKSCAAGKESNNYATA